MDDTGINFYIKIIKSKRLLMFLFLSFIALFYDNF